MYLYPDAKYTLCTVLPNSSIKANISYVDGWAVNIYDNFLFLLLETNRKTCHMLPAQLSTYPFFFRGEGPSRDC